MRFMGFILFTIGMYVNVSDIWEMSVGCPTDTVLSGILQSVMLFGWWPGAAMILWLAPALIGLLAMIHPNRRLNRPRQINRQGE